MTKHDEIRQILAETGFKFEDGRSALEMTDEEVEVWVAHFLKMMSELGRQLAAVMHNLTVSITQAIQPLQELNTLLQQDAEKLQ